MTVPYTDNDETDNDETDSETIHGPQGEVFYVGWEPRVVLDFSFRKFCNGLLEQPTKKPILLFLPKGAPITTLATFLGLLSTGERNTVCLIEDATLAITINDTLMPERIRKTTRIVIGDLKMLARTDKGCYGGCVVFAYGCDMPPPRVDRQHQMYLDDKTQFIAQLCGWNAHVVFLHQPFHDVPDDVLAAMNEDAKARRLMCEMSTARQISNFGSRFRSCGRRVTLVAAELAGSDRSAAACFYLQIFRVSGTGSRRFVCQDVVATIFETESDAIKFYKSEEGEEQSSSDGSPCWFMNKNHYDTWTQVTSKTKENDS